MDGSEQSLLASATSVQRRQSIKADGVVSLQDRVSD
jgi:hypothetical protein